MSDELKPCPFCGHKPPSDLIDTLYPSGIVWREIPEEDGMRSYHSWKDQMLGDHDCYRMGCDVVNGGCGAVMHADSRDEVIAAWNRRAQPAKEVQKDAERYRWLRDPMSGSTRHDPKVYKDGPQEDVEWAYGEELDTIVDEAMARDFAQRAKWEKKP